MRTRHPKKDKKTPPRRFYVVPCKKQSTVATTTRRNSLKSSWVHSWCTSYAIYVHYMFACCCCYYGCNPSIPVLFHNVTFSNLDGCCWWMIILFLVGREQDRLLVRDIIHVLRWSQRRKSLSGVVGYERISSFSINSKDYLSAFRKFGWHSRKRIMHRLAMIAYRSIYYRSWHLDWSESSGCNSNGSILW